jgi:AdoMet-dependent rRNA methyltransferase SPB1
MTAPLDIGLEQQDASLGIGQDDMFDLGSTEDTIGQNKRSADFLMDDDGNIAGNSSSEDNEDDSDMDDDALDSDEEREKKLIGLEAELDGLYNAYQGRLRERDAKYKVKEARRKNDEQEWAGIKADNNSDDDDDDKDDGGWDKVQDAKINDDDSSSDDSSDESDSESEKRPPINRRKRAQHPTTDSAINSKRPRLVSKLNASIQPESTATSKVWFSQDIFSKVEGLDDITDFSEEDIDIDHHEVDIVFWCYNHISHIFTSRMPNHALRTRVATLRWSLRILKMMVTFGMSMRRTVGKGLNPTYDVSGRLVTHGVSLILLLNDAEYGLVTAEAVTLAQQLVNRQTTKTHLINDGFNRYSLNSKEGLPSWFLDDEAKNYKLNIPITKEAMAALRSKQRALDARPIKKVAEAKARKKFKAAQRLEKAMKKAEGVNATADMSEKEKAQQIDKLMRKGVSSGQKAKKEVKLVVAKGAHKGVKGRPTGIKGRYTMVDSRMKKEVRPRRPLFSSRLT